MSVAGISHRAWPNSLGYYYCEINSVCKASYVSLFGRHSSLRAAETEGNPTVTHYVRVHHPVCTDVVFNLHDVNKTIIIILTIVSVHDRRLN